MTTNKDILAFLVLLGIVVIGAVESMYSKYCAYRIRKAEIESGKVAVTPEDLE